MNKKTKGLLLCLLLCGVAAIGAGCSSQTTYRRVGTTEDYRYSEAMPESDVVVDEGITIDGKFDESLYEGRSWYEGKNVTDWGTNEQIKLTTHFAKTGILISISVEGEEKVYSDVYKSTGLISAVGMYFNFGDALSLHDGLYEIECTATGRSKVSQVGGAILKVIPYEPQTRPLVAVKQNGSILAGECTGYDMEMYLPYALFGRDSRPENNVVINPYIISYNPDQTSNRSWHNLAYEQNSQNAYSGGVTGYTFGKNGFICNKLEVENVAGGTVETGYIRNSMFHASNNAWCVNNEKIIVKITPDSGKSLIGLQVNEQEVFDSVNGGMYEFTATDNVKIVASFADSKYVSGEIALTLKGMQGEDTDVSELNGKSVLLTGNYANIPLTVQDGKIVLDNVAADRYKITVQGCRTETLDLLANELPKTLQLKLVLGYETGKATISEDGKTVTIGAEIDVGSTAFAGNVLFTETFEKNSSITMTVKMSEIPADVGFQSWQRFLVQVTESGKGVFFWLKDGLANVREIASLTDRTKEGSHVTKPWDENAYAWLYTQAISNTGLKLQIVRIGSKIAVNAYNGSAWVKLGEVHCGEDEEAKLGLYGVTCKWEFSEITVGTLTHHEAEGNDDTEYYTDGTNYYSPDGEVTSVADVTE